jgi:hypothetical protein
MIKIEIMQEYSIFDLYRSQLFECSSCGRVAEHLLSSVSKPGAQLELSHAKQYILGNRQCWDKDTWKDNVQIHPQAVGRTDVCLNWCGSLCFWVSGGEIVG